MSNTEKKVSVVITADNHTHQGRPVPKGGRLDDVPERTAERLVAMKVAQIVPADAVKKETK